MDVDAARQYLLGKPEAIEDYPFGPDVAVMKVRDKMFATLGEEQGEGRMNLKCDPDQALALRDIFDAVMPGYHMNKKHWNTLKLDGSIPRGEIERMIDHSYALVVGGLPKKVREGMAVRHGREALYGQRAEKE
ncbi:MAG: MmcQ/YjbR family DNA-binding protein [Pseudomonadales bacterium]|nr:MmcQ/YjbR family DNA-binding protein [Pseudomonadales bacterium]